MSVQLGRSSQACPVKLAGAAAAHDRLSVVDVRGRRPPAWDL